MRYFISCLVFLLISIINSYSQYLIPYATQQPSWVFPFWIEDAHGNKDTLYLGFDSSAHQFPGPPNIDWQFGEQLFVFDTTGTTQAWTGYYAFAGVPDSIDKVDIRNTLNAPFEFGVLNIYMPIVLHWDVSLLRSDSLPFMPNPPLPKAQAEITWFYDPNSIPCSWNDKVLITDTIQSGAVCWYRDSLTIENWFGDTGLTYTFLSLKFTPWTGIIFTGISGPSLNEYFISQNTSAGTLSIYNSSSLIAIDIYNVIGEHIKQIENVDSNEIVTIDISDKTNGVYFLILKAKSGQVYNKKIISVH